MAAAALLLALLAFPAEILEGRVVDEAGNPVAGAAVLVLPAAGGQEEPPAEFRPPAVPRPGDPGDRVPVWMRTDRRADREGRFRVEGLAGGGHWVVASLEGMREGWVLARPGGEEAVVRVPGLREIAGRCTDAETGEPLAGLPVWYGPAYGGASLTLLREPTDAAGRFRIAGLRPGRWVLSFGGLPGGPVEELERGYRSDVLPLVLEDVPAGARDLEVKVSRGLAISGRVVDDLGDPVAGVSVGSKRQSATGGETGGWGRGTVTGADGTFRIGGLAPGLYGVAVGGRAERGEWMDRFGGGDAKEKASNARVRGTGVDRVPAGTAGLVIRADRILRITGTAADPGGRPWRPGEDSPLYVNLAGGPLAGSSLGLQATLRRDGTFATEPLDPGGVYDVLLFLGGGRGSGAARGIRAGTDGVVLRVGLGTALAGVVVDGEGRPVGAGVPVEALATGLAEGSPGGFRRTVTADDGSFTLPDLADMSVELTAGGGASPWLRTTAPGEFLPGEPPVRLSVRRGAAVSGRLVDAEGRPVRAAWAACGAGEAFPCGEDGSFRIGGLLPGKVRLSAWIGGREVDLGTVEAPAEGLEVRVPGK